MKRLSSVLSLISLLAVLVGPATAAAAEDKRDLPERDEQHLTAELSPGATVEISDISGNVDIETTSGGTAQIDVVRSAHNRKDLERGQIEVQSTSDRLLVRTKPGRDNWGWGNHEIRQRITLRVPRDVNLKISDISGNVDAGDIAGSAHVSDISGNVKLAQVGSSCTVTDISGGVQVTISQLGDAGVHVSDVSGWVKMLFVSAVNANLHVSDVSGDVDVDLPDLSVVGKMNRDDYRATLGSGGAPIEVSDVSGQVKLAPAGQ